MDGEVVAFDSKRGLGEIRGADDRAYPFHCTKIADGTREIPVGVAVEFTVVPGPLGRWEAVAIRPRAAHAADVGGTPPGPRPRAAHAADVGGTPPIPRGR